MANSTTIDTPYKHAQTVGYNLQNAEKNLMQAYSLKEGDAGIDTLARSLGATALPAGVPGHTLRSLQLIAEQRFQHSSQVLNMFSGLLDKIDQLKQRLISKFSN